VSFLANFAPPANDRVCKSYIRSLFLRTSSFSQIPASSRRDPLPSSVVRRRPSVIRALPSLLPAALRDSLTLAKSRSRHLHLNLAYIVFFAADFDFFMQTASKQQALQVQRNKLASSYGQLLDEFSARELRTVGNYTLGRLIGKGSFGKVYLANHKLTNGSKVRHESAEIGDTDSTSAGCSQICEKG
jgi:hypothetical protein